MGAGRARVVGRCEDARSAERGAPAGRDRQRIAAPGELASLWSRIVAAAIDAVAWAVGIPIVTGLGTFFFTGSEPGVVILDPALYDLVFVLVLLVVPLA